MQRCKQCKAVISWDLADILSGEKETPKRVSRESAKIGLCEDCFEEDKKHIEAQRNALGKVF
jgi:hypothetical protein